VVGPGVKSFVPDLVGRTLQANNEDAAGCSLQPSRAAQAAMGARGLRPARAAGGPDAFDARSGTRSGSGRRRSAGAGAHQLAGERLRREGRRREAVQLRAAYEAFSAVGAAPWQARAAVELRATGEQIADEVKPLPDLTPQELHIAQLVAEGKTNKEIAASMFLSPKTVEYHLANTFRKLDSTPRRARAHRRAGRIGRVGPLAAPSGVPCRGADHRRQSEGHRIAAPPGTTRARRATAYARPRTT
jgi:DNA-binding CsgD family transcriptional regulator